MPSSPQLAPAPSDPHLDPEKARAALRAFFEIAERWSLAVDEARVLLGRPARSTFFQWKKHGASSIPYDTLRRISYLLGIYRTLQILFPDEDQADGWVSRPNEAFAGDSALEHMLGGDVADLADVRRLLDTVRGQGL